MKIVHTADWHIGQTFYEYDRKLEHLQFLSWLQTVIKQEEVDLLLIAGDLFDSPNPAAEAQKVYYRFLREVTAANKNLQIIIIAGNHDSAARLEAPSPLLEEMNISIRGVIKRTETGEIDWNNLIIPLTKGGYCLAVPYLRQGDYPTAETYAEGVQKMYTTLFEALPDQQQPIIAMGHLQATGSEISENDRSERTIIGGLEAIAPEAFNPAIAYTALGHLHRAQRVSGREHVRYSGAPLPMSFAERNNKQGVTIVEITEKGTDIEQRIFDTPVKLLSIPRTPQPLEAVLEAIEQLPEGAIDPTTPYLEIKVLITEPEPSLRHQIEHALQNKAVRLARITSTAAQQLENESVITYEALQTINPLEMATAIFKRKYSGNEMPEEMSKLLLHVIQGLEK